MLDIYSLSDEILVSILEYLHNDLKSFKNFCITCEYFYSFLINKYLWKYFSKNTKYYSMIESMNKSIDISWIEAFKSFDLKIVQTIEILIGDRNKPTNTHLVQINCKGECFVDNITLTFLNIISHSDILDNSIVNSDIIYNEITYNKINYKMGKLNFTNQSNKIKIVELFSYDPTVILLSKDNRI